MQNSTNISSSFSKYCTGGYEFAFNGQEKTDEVSGVGNHLDFKYRGYDPQTGRFWSVDPLFKDYPWNSTYCFAENRVIDGIDLEGKEWNGVVYALYTTLALHLINADDNQKKVNNVFKTVNTMHPIKPLSKGKDVISFGISFDLVENVKLDLKASFNSKKGITNTAGVSIDAGKYGNAAAEATIIYKDPDNHNKMKTEINADIKTPIAPSNVKNTDTDIMIPFGAVTINFSEYGRIMADLYKTIESYCKSAYDCATNPQNYIPSDN